MTSSILLEGRDQILPRPITRAIRAVGSQLFPLPENVVSFSSRRVLRSPPSPIDLKKASFTSLDRTDLELRHFPFFVMDPFHLSI